jgi:hypothetical protein
MQFPNRTLLKKTSEKALEKRRESGCGAFERPF